MAEMSASQLNELWHLDLKWAHELLGLPLRKCSQVPNAWGTPMIDAEFNQLKIFIKRMWLRAAIIFTSNLTETNVWGLEVTGLSEKNVSLPESSFTMLGWLARAPSAGQCPTAHRYLRSPIGTDLYLGGPLSLANWSKKPTLKATRSLSNSFPSKYCYQVSTVKSLPPGTEITWNYGLHVQPNFHPQDEWMLQTCCTQRLHVPQDKPEFPKSTGGKRLRLVKPHRYCTYCGLNIDDESVDQVSRKNIKSHIALNHTQQICFDKGLDVALESGVPQNDFFSELHVVNKVIASLGAYGYTIKPACHFFQVLGCEVLPSNANDQCKEEMFLLFQDEAKRAFRNYQVLYLRGVTVPSSYHELEPVKVSCYADVSWENHKKPRSNSFSIDKILSDAEKEDLNKEIQEKVEKIVEAYNEL